MSDENKNPTKEVNSGEVVSVRDGGTARGTGKIHMMDDTDIQEK